MPSLIEAIDIKRKMFFEFEAAPYHCLDVEVSKPTARGGQTLVRLKMRNLLTRAVFDKTFKAAEKFSEPDLVQVPATYQYNDGDAYHFMEDVTFETLSLSAETLGDDRDLLTDNLASLMAVGVVKLKAAAQDGVRVRASAGASSFRREEKLESLLATARERVAALKKQVDDDPGADSRRKMAAQARTALAREARIEAALARLPELADVKKRQGKKPEESRASTTDAEATVMKMGDGGFRPA